MTTSDDGCVVATVLELNGKEISMRGHGSTVVITASRKGYEALRAMADSAIAMLDEPEEAADVN